MLRWTARLCGSKPVVERFEPYPPPDPAPPPAQPPWHSGMRFRPPTRRFQVPKITVQPPTRDSSRRSELNTPGAAL
jgi:hypothetical protein